MIVFSKAQVPNDDCSTATDMGTVSITWPGEVCSDAVTAGFSAVAWGSTHGATPSSPYYSMSNCYGYVNSTTTLANDIWFKYKNTSNSISLRVPTSDTIHINMYYGVDCNNLQPSGCWTHDVSEWQVIFPSNNDTSIWNYIQISGLTPNDSLYYGLCLQWWWQPISYFGIIQVNNNVSITENNLYNINFQLSPNPSTGTLELIANNLFTKEISMRIIDVTGREVYKEELQPYENKYTITLPQGVTNGIYICILSVGDARVSKKIAIIKD